MPELKTWWRLDRMEEGLQGGGGLRFFLQFDPGKQVDRTLPGVSFSTLFSLFLAWTRSRSSSVAVAEDGRDSAAAVVSAAALAAAVSVCLAAMNASGRPRFVPRRQPLAAAAAAVAGPSSAARPRALPAPDEGLRILSSNNESSENVIHSASIGAGDDEPVIVARVETTQGDETEHGQSEEERREHERLRELWLSLVEREQRLELRRQELEGLREQEATVRELENRVCAAGMEARLLELKVASLQDENGRLRAQLEELDDARAELARAKEALLAIKARVESVQEEAGALRERVAELERSGEERANKLAAEAAALREANTVLEEENMELALRLKDAEQVASSVHLAIEEDMAEQAKQLREDNEGLTRRIEQLRSDHCAHVEELVYLKWINACLRHELSEHGFHRQCSEHQHHDVSNVIDSGMSAMELSRSMSYRSRERAKQLMLRYGHPGLDPTLFSPRHESMDGDERTARAHNYDEPARSPPGTSVTTTAATSIAGASGKKSGPRKLKFLGNFKKLLPGGKRSHSNHGGAGGGGRESRMAPSPMPSDEYIEKAMQWLSTHDVLDFDHSYEATPLSSCDRTPPSSVTTVTVTYRGERGATLEDAEAKPATLARSKSDGGKSYGREASRYHSLLPDHPAADDTGQRRSCSAPVTRVAPQNWERRRCSKELSPGAARGALALDREHNYRK